MKRQHRQAVALCSTATSRRRTYVTEEPANIARALATQVASAFVFQTPMPPYAPYAPYAVGVSR